MTDNINKSEAIGLTLSSLVSSLGIKASTEFIDDVSRCLIVENILPDEEIVLFFDAIYSSAVSFADNVVINKVFADNKEIVRTFADLYKKHEYISKENPLTLSGITEVASDYLRSVDILPIGVSEDSAANKLTVSDSDGNRLLSVAFDKKEALPYGYIKQEKKVTTVLNNGTPLVLIEGDAIDYDSLYADTLFNECVIKSTEVDSRGLLYAILSISNGALVEASGLELKNLVLSYHGGHIVAVAPERIAELLALAKSKGLSTRVFAKSASVPSVKLNYRSGEINLRSGFLRRLFGYKKVFDAECPSEVFTPTEYTPLFCTDGAFEDTLNYDRHIISARCTKQCSFVNGINTVLDSVFALLSKGIDRRKISISLCVGANMQNINSAFAAILGAYRVIMELCLPIGSSKVSFSDNEHILCLAYAEDECVEVCYDQEKNSDNIYLLSFKRFANTSPELMPDFDELRKMCDFLYSSISSKAFVRVYAINGPALSKANAVSPAECEFIPIADDGVTEETYAQGFIVETKPSLILKAPRIGFLKQKTYVGQTTEE